VVDYADFEFDDEFEGAEGAEEEAEGEEEEEEFVEYALPVLAPGEQLDVAALALLPVSMQLQLLQRQAEAAAAANRSELQRASEAAPTAFSSLQLANYLASGAGRRQLRALQQAAGGGGPIGAHGANGQRIAGDSVRAAPASNGPVR